jgi:hypothetical protein
LHTKKLEGFISKSNVNNRGDELTVTPSDEPHGSAGGDAASPYHNTVDALPRIPIFPSPAGDEWIVRENPVFDTKEVGATQQRRPTTTRWMRCHASPSSRHS